MRKKISIICLMIIISLFFCSCKKKENNTWEAQSLTVSNTMIGQSSEILGYVERHIPEESNEGLSRYPYYGTNLANITYEEKISLINESNYLRSSSTTYDEMDINGNLYLNGEEINRKLYKHTASENFFFGNVDDNERAVIKKITIDPKRNGNYITGLYAPAGEVIKVEISNEDLEKTGGVKIEIGQFPQNNQLNNIWEARDDFSRMPHIGNEMLVSKTTSYVGAYLGGPIYVTPVNKSSFTITISGAVEYCHFIYGLTTKEEFERLSKTSAPYFDLEVWDNSVRHSGPKSMTNLDYDNLEKISEFWLATSNISRQIPSGSSLDMGITFLYDTFVCAGAACAIVGRNWCNMPVGWMASALDYDSFTQSGAWGSIHEFNHHFQRYGFEPGDEVTNNAVSLLSYINNTNISSYRSKGLSGWNRYLDPEISLKETLSLSEENQTISSLSAYADIIHTFGVDTFIKAAKYGAGSGGVDTWYEALSTSSGYDMSYYFESILHQTISSTVKDNYSLLKPYIPATFKYQTGRVIDGNEIITVKPYKVDYNDRITIDLDNDLVLPNGFSYEVKSISSPTSGKIIKNTNNTYTYIRGNNSSSGQMKLVITVTNNDITEDLEFIFEFEDDYLGIEATRYTYLDNIYSDALEATLNNFQGYSSKIDETIDKHFINQVKNNEIYTYSGKIYINKDGSYKIGVRTSSRSNTYVEFALNSSNYTDNFNSLKEAPIDYNTDNITYNCKKGDYIYFRITIQSFHNDAYAEIFMGFNDESMTSLSTNFLYNNNSKGFIQYQINDLYPKTYSASNITCDSSIQNIVSYTEDYSAWDDNFKIENAIDGKDNTSYHSVNGKTIDSEPFELTIDLGKNQIVNTLKITGYTGPQMHMPITFKLYGGTTLDNMLLLGDYKDVEFSGRYLSVYFNKTEIRYYKIIITDTSNHRYIAISEINMALNTTGNIITPGIATYYCNNNSNFSTINTQSTFGSVVKGNGIIKLNTFGSSFGIFTKNNEEAKIRLTIDGISKEITINSNSLSVYEILDNGNHQIEIEILEGELIIDSFII
ncbi:MAG: M60 family metallopeptidase [Anaeroplasmataceae bacterium]